LGHFILLQGIARSQLKTQLFGKYTLNIGVKNIFKGQTNSAFAPFQMQDIEF